MDNKADAASVDAARAIAISMGCLLDVVLRGHSRSAQLLHTPAADILDVPVAGDALARSSGSDLRGGRRSCSSACGPRASTARTYTPPRRAVSVSGESAQVRQDTAACLSGQLLPCAMREVFPPDRPSSAARLA